MDQEFVGIGVEVEGPPAVEELRVVSPVYGSPAFRAGMRAGDVILEIEGVSTKTMDINAAVKRMKGLPGTRVTLLIRHVGEEQPIRLVVQRELIHTKSVLGDTIRQDGQWNYFLASEPRIGYVRITTFGEQTASELREVLQFKDHPIDALILDLRGNVGGLLEAAVETCDMFIDEGVIVSTRGRHADDERTYSATADGTILDPAITMVVLADRYSASASEIVAACLKDHQRAVVVGQRTWGKGTVQNVIPLERGTSAIKLTTASYWCPSGKNIHRSRNATEEDDWGVRPSGEWKWC
jgi:carboxyl-terminal processing protease